MKLNNEKLVEITREEIIIALHNTPKDEELVDLQIQEIIEKPAYELAGKSFLKDSVDDVFADINLLRDTQRDFIEDEN